MKKYNLLILVISLIFAQKIYSQSFSSGYFVSQTPALDEETRMMLEDKIKVALSEAGVNTVNGYYPVVTCINYDEKEMIEVPGIRSSYKAIGNVTLLLLFEKSQKLISAKAFKVEGVGTSKEIAQRNAFDQIEIPSSDIKALFSKAKIVYKKEVAKTAAPVSIKEPVKASEVKVAKGVTETPKTQENKTSTNQLSGTMKQSRSDVNQAYQKLFNKLFKK